MLALFYQIFTFANVTFMLKGLAMSVAIAVLATVISMFFGTILALIRTYANGPFQWASALVAVYTEFFRCTQTCCGFSGSISPSREIRSQFPCSPSPCSPPLSWLRSSAAA